MTREVGPEHGRSARADAERAGYRAATRFRCGTRPGASSGRRPPVAGLAHFARAALVPLARVAEHDLVPGRHRGPPAARCLPALACRLLVRGLRLSLLS